MRIQKAECKGIRFEIGTSYSDCQCLDNSFDIFILVPMLLLHRPPIFNRLPEAESWHAYCISTSAATADNHGR
jgi:hypothetical protein